MLDTKPSEMNMECYPNGSCEPVDAECYPICYPSDSDCRPDCSPTFLGNTFKIEVNNINELYI